MRRQSLFHVKNRTLLAVAGCVWMLAGFNVARLGILSYRKISSVLVMHILLSIIVFVAFGLMFYKMSIKHTKRIKGYKEEFRPIWHFFDIKAYCIMAFMMGGGIWLRSSGLVPDIFIAVFYTGLGCALTLAGILFWVMYFRFYDDSEEM
ncbi:MAG: hypothetical protein SOY42_13680 [Clostridium sp.]|nr:hypothetical protein [Clostridium sp.]